MCSALMGIWRAQGMFPGCSLPSDELGQSLGQAHNETPEGLGGFISLCCSNDPRVFAQGHSDPCWFLLAQTGKWELLLPRHCDAASQVPEYHQMTIDFLAGRLSWKRENCSLAWLRVVKKRKSAKCRLQTPACLADPAYPGRQGEGHSQGQKQALELFCLMWIEH